jgi:hypothetical protein
MNQMSGAVADSEYKLEIVSFSEAYQFLVKTSNWRESQLNLVCAHISFSRHKDILNFKLSLPESTNSQKLDSLYHTLMSQNDSFL